MRPARLTVAAIVAVTAVTTSLAQEPQRQATDPRFEVVSIKRNTSTDLNTRFDWRPNGSLTVTNLPVRTVIFRAFPSMNVVPIAWRLPSQSGYTW